MDTQTKDPAVVDRLEKLGFKKAGAKVKELAILQRKMAIAYEHYRYVRPEKIDAFNKKLYDKTRDKLGQYQRLSFTPVENYEEVPPTHVLDAMDVALGRNCFDSFEVAHIVNVKDPILFGRITSCQDRFFIDQWLDDVKIEDILTPNEG